MPLNLDLINQQPPESAFEAPPPKRPSLSLGFMAAPVAGNVLDAASTISGIANGGKEGNSIMAPLAEHPALLVAAKTGLGVGEALLLKKLADKHKTLAKVLSVIAGVVPAAAAVHNFTRKDPKP